MSGIGGGLGTVIGSGLAASELSGAQGSVNNIADSFSGNTTGAYNNFGQSFLPGATGAINNISSVAGADPNLNYNTFMQNYQTSPGAQYQIDLSNKTQNNSAAANESLLSGSNERALATQDQGIASTYANNAYTNYLAGNNQQFGQLSTALGDMFGAIGIGTQVTGQDASVDTAQMNNTSQIAQAAAKNDQAKGSGIGSILGGIGKLAF